MLSSGSAQVGIAGLLDLNEVRIAGLLDLNDLIVNSAGDRSAI